MKTPDEIAKTLIGAQALEIAILRAQLEDARNAPRVLPMSTTQTATVAK